MVNKQIEIEGYGTIVINPINFVDKEYEDVDIEGKPLTWVKGSVTKGYFVNSDGIEVPESQARKKVEIEGEIILLGKFSPTKRVDAEDIEIIDDNMQIYTATDTKSYKVFSENVKLKKLILDDKKTLRFPIVFGYGRKMYTGILTNWKGQLFLCGCRGNKDEIFDKYKDDAVDITIDVIPQKQQTKKLLKVFA